jgi:hypothetical protein
MTPIERLAVVGFGLEKWEKVGEISRGAYCCAVHNILTELRAMAHDPGTLDACLAATNATNNYIGHANARAIIGTFIDRILNEGGGDGSAA